MSLIAWLPLNEPIIKETILNRTITKAGSLNLPNYGVSNTTYDKRTGDAKVGWFGKIGPGYTFKNSGIHMTNINITKANIGLSNVDNTSDVNKPISTATQNALNLKANEHLDDPVFFSTNVLLSNLNVLFIA